MSFVETLEPPDDGRERMTGLLNGLRERIDFSGHERTGAGDGA